MWKNLLPCVHIPAHRRARFVRSPETGYMLGAMRWMAGNPERRCCDRCWEATHARDRAKCFTEALLIAGDQGFCDIVDWRVLSCLSTQWRDAMRTIIDEWTSCAQLRPYVRPKQGQMRLMRINAARVWARGVERAALLCENTYSHICATKQRHMVRRLSRRPGVPARAHPSRRWLPTPCFCLRGHDGHAAHSALVGRETA